MQLYHASQVHVYWMDTSISISYKVANISGTLEMSNQGGLNWSLLHLQFVSSIDVNHR